MGYEIKLYVGETLGKPSGNETVSFLEIATLDLSKIGSGPLSHLIAFAKGKSVPVDFKDFKFLKDVKGDHLEVDASAADFFDVGMDYGMAEVYEGDVKVSEDLYGDPLPLIPLNHVLAAIDEELKTSSYRRYRLAKSLLSEFNSQYWSKNIYVVPFGH